jgi:hypothetical protein
MAPKRISTRMNPQESPITPVSNPELILRRERRFKVRVQIQKVILFSVMENLLQKNLVSLQRTLMKKQLEIL